MLNIKALNRWKLSLSLRISRPTVCFSTTTTPIPFKPQYSICCVDVETTGLSVNHDRIIEIAAIKLVDGFKIGTFSSLICPHPQLKLSDKIIEITSITQDMIDRAPPPGEVLLQFAEFIGNKSTMVFHNAAFDSQIIYHELNRHGLQLDQLKFIQPNGSVGFRSERNQTSKYPQQEISRSTTEGFNVGGNWNHDSGGSARKFVVRTLRVAPRFSIKNSQNNDNDFGSDKIDNMMRPPSSSSSSITTPDVGTSAAMRRIQAHGIQEHDQILVEDEGRMLQNGMDEFNNLNHGRHHHLNIIPTEEEKQPQKHIQEEEEEEEEEYISDTDTDGKGIIPLLCTLKLAKRLYPNFGVVGYKLLQVAQQLRIVDENTSPSSLHRAMTDCALTAKIFQLMYIEVARRLGGGRSPPSLLFLKQLEEAPMDQIDDLFQSLH